MRDSRRTSKTFNSTPERGKWDKSHWQAVGASPWPSRVMGRLRCFARPFSQGASHKSTHSHRTRTCIVTLEEAVHFPLHCPPAVSSMGGRQRHSTRHVRQSQPRGSATIREGHGEAYRRKGAGKRRRRGCMREGTLSRGNVLPIVLTSLPHKVDNILAGS